MCTQPSWLINNDRQIISHIPNYLDKEGHVLKSYRCRHVLENDVFFFVERDVEGLESNNTYFFI